jgi:hypothetical protein
MIARNETSIDSILVELGAGPRSAHDELPNWSPHPRRGEAADLWRLQQVGYDVFRINIHTNQEMFDWRGADVNLAPRRGPAQHQQAFYEPLRGVRSMRKIERLGRFASAKAYPTLIDWAQSFLITRVALLQPVKHHEHDLYHKTVRIAHPLNDNFDAVFRHQDVITEHPRNSLTTRSDVENVLAEAHLRHVLFAWMPLIGLIVAAWLGVLWWVFLREARIRMR